MNVIWDTVITSVIISISITKILPFICGFISRCLGRYGSIKQIDWSNAPLQFHSKWIFKCELGSPHGTINILGLRGIIYYIITGKSTFIDDEHRRSIRIKL